MILTRYRKVKARVLLLVVHAYLPGIPIAANLALL